MVENAHVTRGIFNHEHAHTPGCETTAASVVVHRRVTVYSDTSRLSGQCDLIEEHADGRLVPVEYKQGRRGQWNNDQAQLCAQALCLEEMTGKTLADGALFYFGSRRRLEVPFTAELRAATLALIAAMHRAVAEGMIPPHTTLRSRCRGCSLAGICLPDETARLRREGNTQR
jgi:CRISPR-associated exonuclease Cas4